MSQYDTTKNGIVTRLAGQGFKESKQPFDFDNAASTEYDRAFILNCKSGEMDDESSETICDRFYDFQDWEIQIAFSKSSHNDIITRDDMHRKKDAIIKDLDNPSNWSSFARILKYKRWSVEETDNYYLLTMEIEVQVKYQY